MPDDTPRYLIVSTGRSGSSLLAAILVDAGAEFDMAPRKKWNPGSGAYEHPLILSAARWRSRADKINTSLIPHWLGYEYCLKRMRRDLQALLDAARFVKSTPLVWMTPAIRQIGYSIRLIIPYRPFIDYARSHHLRGAKPVTELAQDYVAAYSTALLQLQTFGGCVVSYDDLMNEHEAAWANVLAQLTGLNEEHLLHSRAQRLIPHPSPPAAPLFDFGVLDRRVEAVYTALEALKGRVIAPEA
jgi:hypothetical protein